MSSSLTVFVVAVTSFVATACVKNLERDALVKEGNRPPSAQSDPADPSLDRVHKALAAHLGPFDSADGFFQRIRESRSKSFFLIDRTRNELIHADKYTPRVAVILDDLLLSFAGTAGVKGGGRVEILLLQSSEGPNLAATLDLKTLRLQPEHKACAGCHGPLIRPIWSGYNFWEGLRGIVPFGQDSRESYLAHFDQSDQVRNENLLRPRWSQAGARYTFVSDVLPSVRTLAKMNEDLTEQIFLHNMNSLFTRLRAEKALEPFYESLGELRVPIELPVGSLKKFSESLLGADGLPEEWDRERRLKLLRDAAQRDAALEAEGGRELYRKALTVVADFNLGEEVAAMAGPERSYESGTRCRAVVELLLESFQINIDLLDYSSALRKTIPAEAVVSGSDRYLIDNVARASFADGGSGFSRICFLFGVARQREASDSSWNAFKEPSQSYYF